MNKFKNFKFALLVGLAGLVTSCDKYFEGINDDPNRPTDVGPELLLPTAQAFLAYGNSGDLARYTSMFVQHITGADRQFATYQTYNIGESDMDNWWRFNMYGGGLYDLHIIIQKAEADELPQYSGVAKILMAYGLMYVTDNLGDIPYSDAFKGGEGTAPTYDTQEEIYTAIQTLITEAKAELAEPDGALTPGADDLVYGGDVAAWTAFANFLSARAYIHLGKVNASNYTAALAAIDAGALTSNADNAAYFFGTDPTAAAPWSQYIEQRDDIDYTGFIYDHMAATNDPRLAVYTDGAGGLGATFAAADAGYYFGTYAEQKFIEAEAAFQSSNPTRAAAAHNEGVLASLGRHGISDPTYEAANATETSATITLEKIMTQKYVAMFLEPEAFTDWRRTGFPVLTAVTPNVTGGVIPRRLPYPQSERTFNGGNVPAVPSITSKVWWDQ
jgi:Starch-binding associating with outer membrane